MILAVAHRLFRFWDKAFRNSVSDWEAWAKSLKGAGGTPNHDRR